MPADPPQLGNHGTHGEHAMDAMPAELEEGGDHGRLPFPDDPEDEPEQTTLDPILHHDPDDSGRFAQ